MTEGEKTATVRVLPSGIEFSARSGQTVLEAANADDVSWPTVCDGARECTRCFFEVVSGAENLSEMDVPEHDALDAIRWRGNPRESERLGCCAQVYGDILVRRRSVIRREKKEK